MASGAGVAGFAGCTVVTTGVGVVEFAVVLATDFWLPAGDCAAFLFLHVPQSVLLLSFASASVRLAGQLLQFLADTSLLIYIHKG